jgi:hypothetical protein
MEGPQIAEILFVGLAVPENKIYYAALLLDKGRVTDSCGLICFNSGAG